MCLDCLSRMCIDCTRRADFLILAAPPSRLRIRACRTHVDGARAAVIRTTGAAPTVTLFAPTATGGTR